MLKVGPIENAAAAADEPLPSERDEVASLRRQVSELSARVRTAERRAELAEAGARVMAKVAVWGGRSAS